jgi:hypothetical protein
LPGSIKVSGSQRTVASPYVKVSGTWRQVAAGYIKVAGSWRVWHSADISDNFNRPNSSTLGTASNGIAQWITLRGSWGVSSFQASSTTAASSGALATTTLTKPVPNYQIDLDIPSGAGVGTAFWVTDQNNWWAAITYQTTSTSYVCPSGGTLSGSTCNTTSSYSASLASGSSYVGPATQSTQYYVEEVRFGYEPIGIDCGPQCTQLGGSCIDGTCKEPGPYIYCTSTPTSTPSDFCSSVSYSCSPPSYLSGTDCYTSSSYYYCPSGGDLSGTTCTVSSSYPATIATTTSYSVRLINSASGTISTVQTLSTSGETKSLRVTTANNAVNVKAYGSAGQSGTATELNYTATSPTITGNLGVIKSIPVTGGSASANQTNIVDNFGAR